MPLVEESIDIKMSADQLYPIISDFESYPEIMEGVKKVTVLERGDGYTVSEWISEVDKRVIRWVERDTYIPEENRIDFKLVEGDLKMFDGFWKLDENGVNTNVTFNIEFEFGIPMLAALLHPLLAKKLRVNMRDMLADLKKRAEA
ncbi:MAG TPA: SRPBCC family protein [Candidatus Aquicultor sp.]|jgi:ribosome-associated toxin RatA of RatAB toxin-antitoxin module